MEEIFKKLSAHFIKGMMVHDQLANYYDFLGLRGYKRCHEYQFYCDTIAYRKINRYYINHHSVLIPEMKVDDPEIIPDGWYRYKREEVDAQTKRNAIETGMNKWIEWERETKELLEDSIKELYTAGNVADSMFLKEILTHVSRELKYAERKSIELNTMNYSIKEIVQEQGYLHDKYKKKTEELMK